MYEEEFLVLKKNNQSLGLILIVIRVNLNKPVPPRNHVRLVLIIVGKEYRRIEIGRIYSISCLAINKNMWRCYFEYL